MRRAIITNPGVIRALRSTDLVGLVSSRIGSFPNEAKARDRMGRRDATVRSLDAIIEPWLPLERHCTGLYLEQGKVLGLASARPRSGSSAWEVDHLIINAPGREEDACYRLLEHLAELSLRGVERLFLRLDADSSLISPARKAGFFPYLTEDLYCLDAKGLRFALEPLPPHYTLRPKAQTSELNLYQFYRTSVPQTVQQAEGAALREWRDSQERRERRGRKEFVLLREDVIAAWMRVSSEDSLGHVDLLGRRGEKEALEAALLHGLALLKGKDAICCLAPHHQEELHQVLLAHDFVKVASYCVMAKQMALRLRQPHLAPATM